jgi:antitoxin component of MazEF toxin-antitoxin module
MLVQLQKWGNSLAIRIPKSFAKETAIDQGSLLDLSLVDGKLVATPITETEYSLFENGFNVNSFANFCPRNTRNDTKSRSSDVSFNPNSSKNFFHTEQNKL